MSEHQKSSTEVMSEVTHVLADKIKLSTCQRVDRTFYTSFINFFICTVNIL